MNPCLKSLKKFDFPPRLIHVELTESLMVKNAALAKRQLNRLREYGFQLSMDDFGTGYSSLAYLKQFPFHTLKIDRSFISGLNNSEEEYILVKTIIEMAHNFKLKTVAEGVENDKQLDILKHLGCDYAQGYLYSPAIPYDDFVQFIEARSFTKQSIKNG